MNTNSVKLKLIGRICLALVILQSLFIFIEEITFSIIKKTLFNRSVVIMIMMLIFTIVILLWAKFKDIAISIFPVKFSKSYIIATIITIIIY